MLKNENNIFPLVRDPQVTGDSVFGNDISCKVILCGSGAIRLYDCGTGSAGITTDRTSSIYECLVENGLDVSVGIPAVYNADSNLEETTIICVARVAGMEGNDRKDMKLLPEDAEILNQMVNIKREHPNVKLGLILNVCGPVDITMWESSLDGIFCMFLPGMEGGQAMADILAGRVNPSGKLPLTFPKKYMDTPTCLNFPGDDYEVHYGEGIYVGYRYYDKKMIAPMYPFGYGLSYSKFNISNIRSATEASPVQVVYPDGSLELKSMPVFSDSIKIYVDVENMGSEDCLEGMEVVQLYINDRYSHLTKPIKELKKFKKIKLASGENTTVSFEITASDLASYDSYLKAWTVEEGVYNILIGNSSRNIVCSMPVYLEAASPYTYSHTSDIKTLYENTITREHMKLLWDKLELDFGDVLNSYEYEPHIQLKELIKRRMEIEAEEVQKYISEFDSKLSLIKKA
jgi:beta-glucosidase